MQKQRERNWIPWADWLMVGAITLSLMLVIPPLLLSPPNSGWFSVVPKAACAAAAILAGGYPFAILAHYRFLFSNKPTTESRNNPEPAERWLVFVIVLVASAAFIYAVLLKPSGNASPSMQPARSKQLSVYCKARKATGYFYSC